MNLSITKKNNFWIYLFLFVTILAGLYFRLKGLGKWPTAVDEYYILASVKNILKHGLPEFAGGGYYERGLLYQYLISGLITAGMKPEFAGRIITAACNIITVIPIFLLSKRISGKIFASVLVFIFCFSVWEVEFARFARMYAPFQMMFMWYIYFLYGYLVENKKQTLKWLLILSFVSIFVYEASIFICILNFIPIIWNSEKKSLELSIFKNVNIKISYIVLSILIFIAAYFYLSIKFRMIGLTESDILPPNLSFDGVSFSESRFRIPKLLLFPLFQSRSFLLLFIVPAGIGFLSIYRIFKSDIIGISAKFVLILFIIFSFLNLFGLVIVFFIVFYLIDWIKRNDINTALKYFLPAASVLFIFWSIFGLSSDSWHYYFPNENFNSKVIILKTLWKEFLNYPYLYETFVLFRETIPRATYILVLLLAGGTSYLIFKKKEKNFNLRILFSMLVLLIFLVDMLSLLYFDTRYFFFLYPLILILAIFSLENFLSFLKNTKIRTAGFLTCIIIILLLSEDFDLKHITQIDSREINFRENLTHEQVLHYYPRWDVRSPAYYINERLNTNDIVITNQQVNDFYLKKLDYVYYNYRRPDFPGIVTDKGKKERWTNADMIYDENDLLKLLLNNKNTKWFLVNKFYSTKYLEEKNFFESFKKYEVYSNYDSTATVYKVPAEPDIIKTHPFTPPKRG